MRRVLDHLDIVRAHVQFDQPRLDRVEPVEVLVHGSREVLATTQRRLQDRSADPQAAGRGSQQRQRVTDTAKA